MCSSHLLGGRAQLSSHLLGGSSRHSVGMSPPGVLGMTQVRVGDRGRDIPGQSLAIL